MKKGSVIEPLCSADEALVTARAIDDAKKSSRRTGTSRKRTFDLMSHVILTAPCSNNPRYVE